MTTWLLLFGWSLRHDRFAMTAGSIARGLDARPSYHGDRHGTIAASLAEHVEPQARRQYRPTRSRAPASVIHSQRTWRA
jgi:hypothetical protein